MLVCTPYRRSRVIRRQTAMLDATAVLGSKPTSLGRAQCSQQAPKHTQFKALVTVQATRGVPTAYQGELDVNSQLNELASIVRK